MDTIYHYTNLKAFQNIVCSKELWFSRIDGLNDYSEYKYYEHLFKIAKSYFIDENKITDNKYFNTSYFEDYFISLRESYYKMTFTFSLTHNNDSIPMWNYYSNKSGIAIGFNKDLLFAEIFRHLKPYYATSIQDIEYKFENQMDELLSDFDSILKLDGDTDVDDDRLNKIIGDMWEKSHMYKNSSFEYENELRITLCKLDDLQKHETYDKKHFIVTDNDIKQIRKIKVVEYWDNIITHVIISPYNSNDKIIDNIYDFLVEHGINIDKNNIICSSCPVL